MITIIKKGTKRTAKCPKCGALLRFDYTEDVENAGMPIYPGAFMRRGDLTCPQCSHKFEAKFQANYI